VTPGVTPGVTQGGQTAIVLRPDVSLPDWRVVSAPRARAALAANLAATGKAARFAGLAAASDAVWRRLLGLHVELGRAPSADQIADSVCLPCASVAAVLADLASRDIIVRDSAGGIVAAYPFSQPATGHLVSLGDHTLNAMCAIDALGIGAMIGLQTAINIAVATVSVPTKGLSLPLISAGGSGLIITCGALGLLYGVCRRMGEGEEAVPVQEKPRLARS